MLRLEGPLGGCPPGRSSPYTQRVASGVRASREGRSALGLLRAIDYLGLFCRRFIFLDFKASWYFHTCSHCHVPGGRPFALGQPCTGSDVLRRYRFIYIYIYNLLSFYKMYLL